jgi:hypothetical protein
MLLYNYPVKTLSTVQILFPGHNISEVGSTSTTGHKREGKKPTVLGPLFWRVSELVTF